jgi:hypothetical protein
LQRQKIADAFAAARSAERLAEATQDAQDEGKAADARAGADAASAHVAQLRAAEIKRAQMEALRMQVVRAYEDVKKRRAGGTGAPTVVGQVATGALRAGASAGAGPGAKGRSGAAEAVAGGGFGGKPRMSASMIVGRIPGTTLMDI